MPERITAALHQYKIITSGNITLASSVAAPLRGAEKTTKASPSKQAAGGFEPPNNGFANRRLRPLGYAAAKKVTLRLYIKAARCNRKC